MSKILIDEYTVVYDKKHDLIGIMVQNNIYKNNGQKYDIVIEYGDVIMSGSFRKDINKKHAFRRAYIVLGKLY